MTDDADEANPFGLTPAELAEERRLRALDFAVSTCGPDNIRDRVLTVARRYEAYLRGDEITLPPALSGRLAAA